MDDMLAHFGDVCAELGQHLRGDALAFLHEPQQDVFGADVVVAELQRLAQAQLQHLLGSGRERDMTAKRLAALADEFFDLAANRVETDLHLF